MGDRTCLNRSHRTHRSNLLRISRLSRFAKEELVYPDVDHRFIRPFMWILVRCSESSRPFAELHLYKALHPSLWLSFGIAADFVVCCTLVYYFTITKVSSNLTNRLMIRLVRIVVETAIVTIVAAGIKMLLIFSRKDNMHLLFCLLLPRLYSNALLGSLNSRSSIFGGDQVRDSRRRRDLRISNPGSAFNSFFDKMKSPNATPNYEMDNDLEMNQNSHGAQVLEYQPVPNSATLSPPPAHIHTPHLSPPPPFSPTPRPHQS